MNDETMRNGGSTATGDGERDRPHVLPIDPTGVPGLDAVLGGGLTQRALALICGAPGSGKTTLSSQIAVTAAQNGRRALILTALAESTTKLIEHLRTYTFFDADLLGTNLQILSVGQYIEDNLAHAADELVKLVRAERATLVVIDGFDGMRGIDPDPQATRRFLYTVGGALSALGATTLVTSVAAPLSGAFAPQATIADAIVRLDYTLAGMRERRTLEAVKIRGAALLPGLHALTLDVDGARVYPRLEARVAMGRRSGGRGGLVMRDHPTEHDAKATGVIAPFGVPALDALLGGGLSGTTTLLTGEIGTGKTLLGLHFALAGVDRGEHTVVLCFRESRGELLQRADAFAVGARLRQALASGDRLTLLDVDVPPVELNPDLVADELLDIIDRTGARRLVVDSLVDLERAVIAVSGPERVVDYLSALGVALRDRQVSALFIKESRGTRSDATDVDALGPRIDNLLALTQDESSGNLQRDLLIVKTRFTAHDGAHHHFVIQAPDGLIFALEDRRP